ncbi:MAG: hypothetical protein RIR26_392 [Pseudomonadota bacterium]|jgi:hypothetical protein
MSAFSTRPTHDAQVIPLTGSVNLVLVRSGDDEIDFIEASFVELGHITRKHKASNHWKVKGYRRSFFSSGITPCLQNNYLP